MADLHETVLLPTGWSVEWTDMDPGDPEVGPRPDVIWMLKSGGVLVADGNVGTDADGLYEFLTGRVYTDIFEGQVRSPRTADDEDARQILEHLRHTGAVI